MFHGKNERLLIRSSRISLFDPDQYFRPDGARVYAEKYREILISPFWKASCVSQESLRPRSQEC
ncbi:MAG: hypothetical protein CMJ81_23185 [Planctomycetaceae bacterium]|nr:hypothetical protein [Planctomycetaceae bacterium]MBP61843.1 hypothetical protein [Planctomycetaceae bacterium]